MFLCFGEQRHVIALHRLVAEALAETLDVEDADIEALELALGDALAAADTVVDELDDALPDAETVALLVMLQ